MSIRELMRFRERDGVGIEFGFSWTYLADVSLLGNPRSFVSRHTRPRARDTPGDVVDRAPRDRARHRARAVPAPPARRQVIRGGVAPPPHHDDARRDRRPVPGQALARKRARIRPERRPQQDGYERPVVLIVPRYRIANAPNGAHVSRRRAAATRPPQLTPSHLFLTLHHQSRLPRHRSGLPQGETRPKRGRGGQVHARHVRGPAVPRRLTPAPQGGRARLRLPPAPRLPSPRGRPLRAVSLFVCTYGQLE